jgi:hypothetical protein
MNRLAFPRIVFLALCLAGGPTGWAQDDADVSARSKALEVAGAFSNDGYKIRDGYWPGELEPDKPQFLEVNLFNGNEYWFCAAATAPARKIAVAVFDENGKPVDYQTYDNGAMAAAGFAPTVSGKYIVKLTLLEGEKSQFCLLYCYK